MKRRLALATAAVAGATLLSAAPAANASDGCVDQPWWRGEIMRMTTRIICDGPKRPDGSWERRRLFTAPAYWTNAYSSCYRYGCTYYPSRYIPEYSSGVEQYVVTDATVLPDEPGWIA